MIVGMTDFTDPANKERLAVCLGAVFIRSSLAPHLTSRVVLRLKIIRRSRNSVGIVVLEGRAKDTIVLSTGNKPWEGENVEPDQLEDAAMRSSLIQQIVSHWPAIIVPNKEEIIASKGLSTELSKEKITGLLSEELRKWTTDCSFQIGPILVIDEPFTIDSGLMTATMKIRRNQVVELYKDQIDDLYK
ncbi:hypothetical protein Tco_0860367 [Tanacetum coccineum]|uniref:Uncharacterized protein n=1 Tax=Tanacetum coccineum TaxID=301880 RepID=A0ABQ5BEQ9_9ASTR